MNNHWSEGPNMRIQQWRSTSLSYDSFFWSCNGRKLPREAAKNTHLVEQISCQHLLQVLFQLLWEVSCPCDEGCVTPPTGWERDYHSPSFAGDNGISKKHISFQTRTKIIKHHPKTRCFGLDIFLLTFTSIYCKTLFSSRFVFLTTCCFLAIDKTREKTVHIKPENGQQ